MKLRMRARICINRLITVSDKQAHDGVDMLIIGLINTQAQGIVLARPFPYGEIKPAMKISGIDKADKKMITSFCNVDRLHLTMGDIQRLSMT